MKKKPWLIQHSIKNFGNKSLPTKEEVLQYFYYLHEESKKTISSSTATVASKIIEIYKELQVPLKDQRNIVRSIKALYKKYRFLKKNKNKKSTCATVKRHSFIDELKNVFDITLTKPKAYKTAVVKKSEKYNDSVPDNYESDDTSSVCSESSEISDKFYEPPSEKKVKVLRPNILDENVCNALDCANVSNASASLILSTASNSLGVNIKNVSSSKSTVRRERMKKRETLAAEVKDAFSPTCKLTVHWDTKKLPESNKNSSGKVNRLAVVVTGLNIEKLLGIPKLLYDTGEDQAQAVHQLILEWKLDDKISGLCFDTTASNTGPHKGACVLLQEKLNFNPVQFACRHHVHELVVGAAFDSVFGASTGPNIQIFGNFQKAWSDLNKNQYETAVSDKVFFKSLKSVVDDLENLTKTQLNLFQPREDYKKLLQLVLIILGKDSSKCFTIREPGAIHRARWMAKIIY